jgi:hypothetical protein
MYSNDEKTEIILNPIMMNKNASAVERLYRQ